MDVTHGYFPPHTSSSPPDIKIKFRMYLKSSFFSPSPIITSLIQIHQLSFGFLKQLPNCSPYSFSMGIVRCQQGLHTKLLSWQFEVFLWNWIRIWMRVVDFVVIDIEYFKWGKYIALLKKRRVKRRRDEDKNTKQYILLFYSLLLIIFCKSACEWEFFFSSIHQLSEN